MSIKTILTAVILLAVADVRAGVIVSQTFSPNLTIPEGNPVGVVDSEAFTLGVPGQTVGGITVDLNISGGYNGDLYAYLVAPNGTLVTLMNRPGTAADPFGAQSSGMTITLSDSGATSIQSVTGGAGTTLTGTYQADEALVTFNEIPANGTWDIYFADLGGGGGAPVLTSWTLDIDLVPEPMNESLGLFAGAMVAGLGFRRVWQVCKRAASAHSRLKWQP